MSKALLFSYYVQSNSTHSSVLSTQPLYVNYPILYGVRRIAPYTVVSIVSVVVLSDAAKRHMYHRTAVHPNRELDLALLNFVVVHLTVILYLRFATISFDFVSSLTPTGGDGCRFFCHPVSSTSYLRPLPRRACSEKQLRRCTRELTALQLPAVNR